MLNSSLKNSKVEDKTNFWFGFKFHLQYNEDPNNIHPITGHLITTKHNKLAFTCPKMEWQESLNTALDFDGIVYLTSIQTVSVTWLVKPFENRKRCHLIIRPFNYQTSFYIYIKKYSEITRYKPTLSTSLRKDWEWKVYLNVITFFQQFHRSIEVETSLITVTLLLSTYLG